MTTSISIQRKTLHESWTVLWLVGATYDVSESGWMTETVFENWFSSLFLPFCCWKKKTIILTFDGHDSHYETIVKALQENVIIVCLPLHTSHALQPLDVAIFKPFKDHWHRIFLTFYRKIKIKTVDKVISPSLTKKLWGKISSDNLISGFRGAGLWPLNRDAVHKERSMDGETEQPSYTLNNEKINSPWKILKESTVNVIAPPTTKEISEAIDNS